MVSWITKPVQSTALPTGRGIKSYTVSPYSLYTESRVLSVTIAIYSSYLLAHSSENALDILQKLDIMERIFGVEPN